MTVRDELEDILRSSGSKGNVHNLTYRTFFRDHGPALLEALDAKRAIEDHCVLTECVTWKDKKLYDVISEVIAWNVAVALDPRVSDVARDAERYRWLRDKCDTTTGFLLAQRLESDEWDQAIDRARGGGG